jgi:GDP/UDP-N,N'-diacetylbacillosamine 2-epimerase (hydrolysing)
LKKILIVTERRADFSRFKPILKLIKKDKKIKYQIIVTGLHLHKQSGKSINEIYSEKFKIFAKFKMFKNDYFKYNDGAEMSKAIGYCFLELPKLIKKANPDLILSGFDIAANFAISVCGSHMNIPVAHIQGGELSGTIDENLRHAISKFSNFHFTANANTKKRLIKMGEVAKNIFVVGCPSIDALLSEKMLKKDIIKKKFNIDLTKKKILLIQHPVTSEINNAPKQILSTIEAIKKTGLQTLVVFPNRDAGSKYILKKIISSKLSYTETLSLSEYKTFLSSDTILVGNSSSGIHEAATFSVPVVNIGTRQSGREKPKNVIDVSYKKNDIYKAIKKATSSEFYNLIKNLKNPYGNGNSAEKIFKIIKKINFKNFNTQKRNTY